MIVSMKEVGEEGFPDLEFKCIYDDSEWRREHTIRVSAKNGKITAVITSGRVEFSDRGYSDPYISMMVKSAIRVYKALYPEYKVA